MTSKCCKNKEVAQEPQVSVCLMFLPHFDVLCDLLLNIPTATWNLFVLYNKQKGKMTNLPRIASDYSTICASLGAFQITNAIFRLYFFFSSLSFLYTVIRNVFQRLHLLKEE